jgi:ferredoxin
MVRGSCLVAAALVLWLANGTQTPLLVVGISPFVALSSILATRAVAAVAWIGLAVGAIVMLRPHWFCHWICPTGHCADAASRLGQRLGRRPARLPHLGRWLMWLTLGGALLGWPLLLWTDPLAVFAGVFTPLTRGGPPGAWLAIVPALAVLLLSLAWPGAWCGRLCPLGALQDDAARLTQAARRRLGRERPAAPGPGPHPGRRAALGVLAGTASASVLRLNAAPAPRPLRPPGAVGEPDFLGLCVRCGNCSRACPSDIIGPDLGRHGLGSLLSPVLGFATGYCREDCVACTRVCPSGALGALALENKPAARIGLPEVDMTICLLGEDRECSECRRWCPYGAIRFEFSEQDYCLTPRIDPRRCNGCGACETACPTRPRKAIVVAPR